MLLQELNGHENIIKLLNVIKAENNKDIYLVFDYMEIDLHHVNRSNILHDIHKVYIIYQILKCLKYLHSAEIVHRDLKPANILIDAECNVKVADFGLARSIQSFDDESAPVMTDYVATRWYRAPEIVLGSCQYSKAVDIWSVGCILGELLLGKAIFPGKSTINQVELIIQLMGKPNPRDLESINAATDYSIIESMSARKKYSFSQFFKGASKEALDFLKRTLVFDPKKRLTAEQALKHPYVKQFHNPEEEIVCDKIIKLPISDAQKLSIKEYRDALYNDILKKKKEQRKRWKMKYLQQLGINTPQPGEVKRNANRDRAAKETRDRAAKDRRRERNERRATNEGTSKASYGYKKSSGTTGDYKNHHRDYKQGKQTYGNAGTTGTYKSHVDYNKQASYGASKKYAGSSMNKHGSTSGHPGEEQSYKYYKGSSSGVNKKYYKKG
jgi:serine/threonine protein kinase